MKNCLKIVIATVIAALVAPVYVIADVSMCAGQSMDIGAVTVTNDADNLYVSFEIIESGWYLAETHVAVGDDIPVTKKGNPIPGQFPYACELDGSLQSECEVTIPLGELLGEVKIAAHAAVFQLAGDGCRTDIQYASDVVFNNQGMLKDGVNYPAANRSVEESMFQGGEYPPGTSENLGFFSLGFGGDVTVAFGEYPVYNAPGIDLCVQEITNGRPTYPEEMIELFGDNGALPFSIAVVSNRVNGTGLGCVDLPGDVETVDFINIDDITDPTPHNLAADAYDVDWIGACYLYMGEETAWGAACYEDEGTRFVDKGNWGTYFNYEIVTAPENCEISVYGGHIYFICQGSATRPEADTLCSIEEMQLAYINDVDENAHIVDTALAAFGWVDYSSSSYWIANTKSDIVLPYAPGEPNGDGIYHHILRYDSYPYGWNDVPPTYTWGWVCESGD